MDEAAVEQMEVAQMKRIATIVLVGAFSFGSVAMAEPRPIHRTIYTGRLAPAVRMQQRQAIPPPEDRYRHPDSNIDRWYRDAVRAGWPTEDWERLACIIYRESRGQPDAHNPRYPDDSYGLIQLNMRAHRKWVGPLVEGDFTRLFDGYTNLLHGRALYDLAVGYYGNGWRPWVATDGSC